MDADLSNLQSIAARVEKLEKQNRLFKLCGLLLLLSASTLVVMGQARPTRIIEAQTFILKDANGNMRAELNTNKTGDPFLSFLGSKGKVNGWVSGDSLTFYDTSARPVMMLGATQFSFDDAQGKSLMAADASGFMVNGAQGHISLELDSAGAALRLSDPHGFSTTIGSADLVTPSTGETHHTSAASIRMFDDKRNVIWAAP